MVLSAINGCATHEKTCIQLSDVGIIVLSLKYVSVSMLTNAVSVYVVT